MWWCTLHADSVHASPLDIFIPEFRQLLPMTNSFQLEQSIVSSVPYIPLRNRERTRNTTASRLGPSVRRPPVPVPVPVPVSSTAPLRSFVVRMSSTLSNSSPKRRELRLSESSSRRPRSRCRRGAEAAHVLGEDVGLLLLPPSGSQLRQADHWYPSTTVTSCRTRSVGELWVLGRADVHSANYAVRVPLYF
ncbi:hypothetical protein OH76DRAFT_1182709 [Lentinus brumalis]|uniref:Uncharacterized protein n=1 Tax=Lentinus brumalis TaxID=2498619 RepID=A0A371CTZ2_9APHY|nr:hypothetical protein OH76DRAFT_1182709 [Polyporus brumalis]